jgi:hypothetical protein
LVFKIFSPNFNLTYNGDGGTARTGKAGSELVPQGMISFGF